MTISSNLNNAPGSWMVAAPQPDWNKSALTDSQRAQIAQEHNLTPAQLALAFVINKPFVASALTGQTSLVQLRDNLSARHVTLSEEILARIEAIHQRIPNPAP